MLRIFVIAVFLFMHQAQAAENEHEREQRLIVKNHNFNNTKEWSAFKLKANNIEQDIPLPALSEEREYSLSKFHALIVWGEFLKGGELAAHPVGLIDLSTSKIITVAVLNGEGISVNGAGLGYPAAVISYKSEEFLEYVGLPAIKEKQEEKLKVKSRIFLKNDRLLVRQVNPQDESEFAKKFDPKSFITFEEDGFLIDQSKNLIEANDYIYVADKNGKLYISDWKETSCHHSYILQPSSGSSKYGIGKAVSCAGHINISGGKITKLTNMSGHYKPTEDHLLLLAYELFTRNLLAEECEIKIYEDQANTKNLPRSYLATIIPNDIKQKHSLHNLPKSQACMH